MLNKQYPLPVKFLCGLIYSKEDIYLKTASILRKKFGLIDFESEEIDFSFTNYYYPEMGKPLYRKFISFEKLKDPGNFANIKSLCMKLEKKFALENKRQINIDPGYLNEAKLVLTTTKDFSHRIYLEKGIYAEVTLQYHDGIFCDLPSTFPDYRTSLYKDIFFKIRGIYTTQLKSQS